MLRSAGSKVAWVGSTASMVFGLALVVGVASAAFGANGQAWILGQNNAATAITRLAGTAGVEGPMLQLINNNKGTNDTALSLKVQPGEAPLKVNSARRVGRLNADKIDGVDAEGFLRSSTYWKYQFTQGTTFAGNSLMRRANLSCDEGDLLLSGGFNGLNVDTVPGTRLVSNHPSNDLTSWEVQWRNASTESRDQDLVQVIVLCARQ